jgi:hypothetical protein
MSEKLLGSIPGDGKPIGNISLQKKSGFREDEYWSLRNQLIEQGKIGKARGKGGSVYRLLAKVSATAKKRTSSRKGVEADLYPSFEKWLANFWAKDANLTTFFAERTANQGKKSTGGKWTRPDFAVVAINTYRYLPGKFLEVISFELKPNLQDAFTGVFECAAHSVYANRSYLAVHVADDSELKSQEYTRIENECERFGLGLIVFSKPDDNETYEITVDAEHRTPDPVEVDKFIASQLKVETQALILKQIK